MQGRKLSARLKAVAGLLPRCECIADVGCDHGQLGLHLLLTNRCQRLIASDISAMSLQKAQSLFYENGLEDRVQTLQCDGLPQKGGMQAAVIAGLGESTVWGIVERGFEAARNLDLLVLQPADDAAELRRRLWSAGYAFVAETVVHEGRFFPVMAVRYDGRQRLPLDGTACELGPVNMHRPDKTLLQYADWRIRVWEKALKAPAQSEAGQLNQRRIIHLVNALKLWREENASAADA